MWTKIAIAGAVGAAILGTGAAALAETGTSGSTATPSSTSATASPSVAPLGRLSGKLKVALGRFEHGSWVAADKSTSTDITHDAVKGAVTAVSPTSISVKASDGFSETFVVDTATAVRIKGTKAAGAIGSVKVGDTVLVTGTKSGSTATAKHVLDGGAK
jgi:hypothetical protein